MSKNPSGYDSLIGTFPNRSKFAAETDAERTENVSLRDTSVTSTQGLLLFSPRKCVNLPKKASLHQKIGKLVLEYFLLFPVLLNQGLQQSLLNNSFFFGELTLIRGLKRIGSCGKVMCRIAASEAK